jgi:hypothetical protein
MVRIGPLESMILGDVGEIGDAERSAIPFKRLSMTTFPNLCKIPLTVG